MALTLTVQQIGALNRELETINTHSQIILGMLPSILEEEIFDPATIARLPVDTIKEICQQMDVSTLNKFIQTSKRHYVICKDIYDVKFKEYETQRIPNLADQIINQTTDKNFYFTRPGQKLPKDVRMEKAPYEYFVIEAGRWDSMEIVMYFNTTPEQGTPWPFEEDLLPDYEENYAPTRGRPKLFKGYYYTSIVDMEDITKERTRNLLIEILTILENKDFVLHSVGTGNFDITKGREL